MAAPLTRPFAGAGIVVDQDTPSSGTLRPTDPDNSQPLGGVQIVLYRESEFLVSEFTERGTTFTKLDGDWCDKIYVDPAHTGINYIARFFRAERVRRTDEGELCIHPQFGPTNVVFVVP